MCTAGYAILHVKNISLEKKILRYAQDNVPLLLLMSVLTKTLFALVSCHFVFLSLLSAWHKMLWFFLVCVFALCLERLYSFQFVEQLF